MLKRLLIVAYFLEVGLLLVLAPWSAFWDRNYFVEAVPVLQTALRNNYVRGAVSGLGIINVAVGLVELGRLMASRRAFDAAP